MRHAVTCVFAVLSLGTAATAQTYAIGSTHCRVDAFSGTVDCTTEQTPFGQKPLYEVLRESLESASAIERNRAIASAMRAQADALRLQANEQARAAAMDRVVALLDSAERLEGAARDTVMNIAIEELHKLYPQVSFPPGALVLVPMSNDGWDLMACERLKLRLDNAYLFEGVFSKSEALHGVRRLVVNMSPDPNHDTLEVFFIDEAGTRKWDEKVAFAWTLNYERQTAKLADRMAARIKDRL